MTAFFGLGGIGWSSIWIQNSDGGQIVESTPSRPRCYYLALKADAGSVPCSTTNNKTPTVLGWGFFLPDRACRPIYGKCVISVVICGYARGEPILRMTGVDGQHASAGFALP